MFWTKIKVAFFTKHKKWKRGSQACRDTGLVAWPDPSGLSVNVCCVQARYTASVLTFETQDGGRSRVICRWGWRFAGRKQHQTDRVLWWSRRSNRTGIFCTCVWCSQSFNTRQTGNGACESESVNVTVTVTHTILKGKRKSTQLSQSCLEQHASSTMIYKYFLSPAKPGHSYKNAGFFPTCWLSDCAVCPLSRKPNIYGNRRQHQSLNQLITTYHALSVNINICLFFSRTNPVWNNSIFHDPGPTPRDYSSSWLCCWLSLWVYDYM